MIWTNIHKKHDYCLWTFFATNFKTKVLRITPKKTRFSKNDLICFEKMIWPHFLKKFISFALKYKKWIILMELQIKNCHDYFYVLRYVLLALLLPLVLILLLLLVLPYVPLSTIHAQHIYSKKYFISWL